MTAAETAEIMTAKIVAAYAANNALNAADLAALIQNVHAALVKTSSPVPEVEAAALVPAVSIKKSITPDFLICLDDGKKFKSLKRHLGQLGMTPDEYRAKWGLPSNYPIVAPNYSATRSNLAKSFGLGRKPAAVEAPKASRAKKTAHS